MKKMPWSIAGIFLLLVCGFGAKSVFVPDSAIQVPETVHVPGDRIRFRPFGNFSFENKTRTPRAILVDVAGFDIMKFQVRRDEYARCVADGDCKATDATGGSLPQTDVNWHDANSYADWLSRKTGVRWRLPTATEWQLAAGERYGEANPDPALMDPGERMISQYRAGTLLRFSTNPALRPVGGFGFNSKGLADISGNIWEWTDSCMQNGILTKAGLVKKAEAYCVVRIAGGVHRAGIIEFVRDASVGGCAAGLPPDHLGFRLVRDSGKPD